MSRPFSWRGAPGRTGVHWLLLIGALLIGLSLPEFRECPGGCAGAQSSIDSLAAQLGGIRYLANQLLNIDHMNADPALPVVSELGVSGGLTLVVLVLATGLALTNVRRWPLPSFAVLWFLLWQAPNFFFARPDLVNDRQLYVALGGPALLLAASIRRLAGRQPRFATLSFVAVLGLTGFATHLRNDVYRDQVTFWRDVVSQSPHNARAFNNLGVALAGQCDLRRAEAAWLRALALDPGHAQAALNLRLLGKGRLPEGVEPCVSPR